MELEFRKASLCDFEIVFSAVGELLDKPLFTLADFEAYWQSLLNGSLGRCDIWLAIKDDKPCAYILANYFPIPRYLGVGIELEEVVTLPAYQRKGIGMAFIKFLVAHYSNEKACRKITVKTDDHAGSGKLYADLFDSTDMRFYQKFLNKV